MTAPRPPEPDAGQDGPPDLLTALRAVRDFLEDVAEDRPDVRRRAVPLRRAVVRLIRDRQA